MDQPNRRAFGFTVFGAVAAVMLPHQAAVAGSFAMARAALGRCSFCRRSTTETKGMISAGPVRICIECISLCLELIEEDDRPRPTRTRPQTLDIEDLRGLSRAEISERIVATGCTCAPGTLQHDEYLDWFEMRLRWDWGEALKNDLETIMNSELSREEIEALLVSRGWPGSTDDPTFQKLVSSVHGLSGKHFEKSPHEIDDVPPPPPPGTPKGTLYCSFCGSVQADVQKLIAGPRVQICDRCADEASKLL